MVPTANPDHMPQQLRASRYALDENAALREGNSERFWEKWERDRPFYGRLHVLLGKVDEQMMRLQKAVKDGWVYAHGAPGTRERRGDCGRAPMGRSSHSPPPSPSRSDYPVGRIRRRMQTRISRTPLPIEETFDEEIRAFLAHVRSLPPVSDEEDPNDWLSQICANLQRSPKERLARRTHFANWSESFTAHKRGLPHVEFSPRRVLGVLMESGASFVFVGMGAGYLRGAPYPTTSTDVTPRCDPENSIKVEHALRLLSSRPRACDQRGVAQDRDPRFRRLMTSAGRST